MSKSKKDTTALLIPDRKGYTGRWVQVTYIPKVRKFIVHLYSKKCEKGLKVHTKFALTHESMAALKQAVGVMWDKHGDVDRVQELLDKHRRKEALREQKKKGADKK